MVAYNRWSAKRLIHFPLVVRITKFAPHETDPTASLGVDVSCLEGLTMLEKVIALTPGYVEPMLVENAPESVRSAFPFLTLLPMNRPKLLLVSMPHAIIPWLPW